MKLWHKLTIIIFIIINIVIQVGVMVLNPQINNLAVDLLGEKLKSIAAATAANINGEDYRNIDLFDTTGINSAVYNKIKQTINQTKENLELTSDKYTISLLNNNSAVFGVVLNRVPFAKDSLQQLGKDAITAVYAVYDKKQCVHTNVYEDRYGEWLSGFAPIFTKDKEIVGVVQVDQNYNSIKATMDEIDNSFFYGRIFLLPFTMIISLFVANIFLKPIRKVKDNILRLSNGDYAENNGIKTSGEIKELTDAAENLRLTILEQQQKIFNTINDLKLSKEKAETSDRMKSEFLAVLSHEIRTPLNVVLGSIGVLQLELEDNNFNEIESIATSISKGSKRLIRTVEMIVLYSELISKTYPKQEKYVKINQTFFNIVEECRSEAVKKGVSIQTNCTATTGTIKADETLLRETINQLVDNAVKYTEKGEIKFCVVDNSDSGICIVIEDTGIGISEEFKKELFKPFRQEDMSYTRKYEGNGIGLALAKKCSDLNGFELIIKSEKHKGTKAEIHIPKEKLFDITN